MPFRPIKIFPDELLATRTHLVREFGPALQALVADLFDTLYATPGVGLAAPQIGVLESVAVVDVSRRPPRKNQATSNHGPIVLINPVLVVGEGIQTPREGCLSVPELLANVRRFERVKVEAKQVDGRTRLIEATGFEALALQHEIDHLDGKLFLDRVTNLKTDVFRRKSF